MENKKTRTKTNGKKAKKRKRKLLIVLAVIVLLAAITYTSGRLSYNYVMKKYAETDRNEPIIVDEKEGVEFVVEKGATTSQIAEKLYEQGLIKNKTIFRLLSKVNGFDGTYKSGTHIVSDKLSYDEMMRVLSSNAVTRKVTIPEGKTVTQIADILYQNKIIKDKAKFLNSVNTEEFDYDFLKNLPKRQYKLEGYLFPDTYEFDYNASDREIITKMLDNFNKKFQQTYRDMIAELPIEMSLDDVVTMASLIEREARDPDERYVISGVLYNRLTSKDKTLRKLQVDATVQYVLLKNTGSYKDRLLYEDLEIDDPYNTYLHEGLPPGPICCPGEASIKAALMPDDNDYYYYVAKGDAAGSHAFARTYKEHQANIKKYSSK